MNKTLKRILVLVAIIILIYIVFHIGKGMMMGFEDNGSQTFGK